MHNRIKEQLCKDLAAKHYSHWEKYASQLVTNYLDALLYGYCCSQEILDYISNWNPLGLSSYGKDELDWLNQIKNNVKDINQKIATDGDLSQTNIKKKLIAFLRKYPQPDNENLIKSLNGNGHCSGLSFIMMASLFQDKFNNRAWVKKILKMLALWNEKDEFTDEQRKEILTFTRIVNNAQESRKILGVNQYDTRIYHDDQNRELKYHAHVAVPFSDMDKLINAVVMPTTTQKKATRFGIFHHATLYSQSEYFDSNNFTGEIASVDAIGLQILLKAAHSPELDVAKTQGSESSIFETIRCAQFSMHDRTAGILSHQLFASDEFKKLNDSCKRYHLRYLVFIDDKETFNLFLPHTDLSDYPKIVDWAMRLDESYYISALFDHTKPPPLHAKTSKSKRTYLHIAARFGKAEIVKVLLKKGIDAHEKICLNPRHTSGYTALHLAARYGHLGVAEAILDHDPSTIRDLTIYDKSVLRIAVEHGQYDLIDLFVARGADVNEKGPDGTSLLDVALSNTNIALACHLMLHGAICYKRNFSYYIHDLLFEAVKQNLPDLVRKLILNHTVYNITDAKGNRLIDFARTDTMRKTIITAKLDRYKRECVSETGHSFWKSQPQRMKVATTLENVIKGEEKAVNLNKFHSKFQKSQHWKLKHVYAEAKRFGYC